MREMTRMRTQAATTTAVHPPQLRDGVLLDQGTVMLKSPRILRLYAMVFCIKHSLLQSRIALGKQFLT